jgi:hypothetical protein
MGAKKERTSKLQELSRLFMHLLQIRYCLICLLTIDVVVFAHEACNCI